MIWLDLLQIVIMIKNELGSMKETRISVSQTTLSKFLTVPNGDNRYKS